MRKHCSLKSLFTQHTISYTHFLCAKNVWKTPKIKFKNSSNLHLQPQVVLKPEVLSIFYTFPYYWLYFFLLGIFYYKILWQHFPLKKTWLHEIFIWSKKALHAKSLFLRSSMFHKEMNSYWNAHVNSYQWVLIQTSNWKDLWMNYTCSIVRISNDSR